MKRFSPIFALLLAIIAAAACNPVIPVPDPGSTTTTSAPATTPTTEAPTTSTTEAPATTTTAAPTTTSTSTTSTSTTMPTQPLVQLSGCDPPKKCHVLKIMTDDENRDEPEHFTPKLMAWLRAHGMVDFTQFVANDPLCGQSRTTDATEMSTTHHGVPCNTPAVACPPYASVASKVYQLAAKTLNNIHTGIFGKYLNWSGACPGETKVAGKYPNAPGWDTYDVLVGNSDLAYGGYSLTINGVATKFNVKNPGDPDYNPGNYGTYKEAELLKADILANTNKQNYWLYTPSAPHAGGVLPEDYNPANNFDVASMPKHSPAFNEGCPTAFDPSDFDKPSLLQTGSDQTSRTKCLGATAWQFDKYSGSLQGVDNAAMDILHTLEITPDPQGGTMADNTIVIYYTDNGTLKGDHHHATKEVPYERAIRLPLYIHVPGVNSHTINVQTWMPDVTATVADYQNVAFTGDGQSLRPLIEGAGTFPVRSSVLIEHNQIQDGIPDVRPWKGIRQDCTALITTCWKLVHYPTLVNDPRYGTVGEEWELYDLVNDPNELTNLLPNGVTHYPGVAPYDDPNNATVVGLKNELAAKTAAGR